MALVDVGEITLMLMSTDETPVAGTPPTPVTFKSMACCGPSGAVELFGRPRPVPVSRMRLGVRGWKNAGGHCTTTGADRSLVFFPTVVARAVIACPATSGARPPFVQRPAVTLVVPA